MILVTGATGKVGGHVLTRLREAGRPVRALSRDPARAGLPADVETVPGSPADVEAATAALTGVDAAFVCLVGDVEPQARAFAEAIRRVGGVRRLVLLSSSAVLHPVRHRIGDEHRAAEEAIGAAAPDATLLRPGPFHTNALWWAKTIREQGTVRCLVGNTPGAPVDPDDLAALAVAALTGDGHARRRYEVTGPEVLTSAEQARVLSDELGRELAFEVASPDDVVAMFAGITGDRPAAESNVAALHSPAVPWGRTTGTLERVLGRKPRTFREWAAANAHLFR
ncbi:NAD(P)H-binding protein [Micromonospora robiginosa]|uniref:NAD(P)H-binding protein n=1 Tax=Micromonospora robiginosa TaxID=2749844 RepID=A0A7L6B3R2_9ACTN|nr:NAD(P)H-binding protein [Micromonospora ferruginea]QLQ36623.1 NAD(P)H-binding protein [Micromonospora ferruginea]